MSFDLPISKIIRRELLQCPPHTPICEAADLMDANRCGSILVMDNGKVLGIWTRADALRVDLGKREAMSAPVSSAMTTAVKTLGEDTSVSAASHFFIQHHIRHALVVDASGHPIGMISQTDIVRLPSLELDVTLKAVGSLISGPALIVPQELALADAARSMAMQGRDAIVVDFHGEYGMLTEQDVLRALGRQETGAQAGQIASRPLISVHADTSLFLARALCQEKGIRHLGVTGEDGSLLGILSQSEVLAGYERDYLSNLQQALAEHKRRLAKADQELQLARQVFDATGEGIMITNREGVIQTVNPAFSRITGYSREEAIGQTPRLLRSGRHADAFYADMWAAIKSTGRWEGEIWDRRKSGEDFPKWLSIRALTDSDDMVSTYIGTFSDVTEKKHAEEALHDREERYRALFNASSDAIFVCLLTPEGLTSIVEVNDVACWRLGYSREELLHLTASSIDATGSLGDFPLIAERLLVKGEAMFVTDHRTKSGRIIPVEISVRAFELKGSRYALCIARDITERQAAEEELRRRAHSDSLTQLPNRSFLLELTKRTLAAATRNGLQFALLFLDLDGFKQINDTHGHEAGDLVLKAVAERMTKAVRGCDIVSRLGGDEFVIVLTEITHMEDAAAVALKVETAVSQPVKFGDAVLDVRTSIGIAVYPRDGLDIPSLMRFADREMYDCKARHRARRQLERG
ncbi:MAG TPA: diguanylate cyclase [Noviherbaspirillum sp.]|uniref:diguanylate cyclase domain-containing protein n=1 Tax=Noviherbaspirillum sp. TaxID=1926288 RepID=UPI002B49DC54|nr:diguanylate cyclase [Noviherbaspirillum sp.]HJV85162.1 diguanylate cyclase [Noviherbaspirillum sp.]